MEERKELIQFQIEDDRTGLRAILFTAEEEPGEVSVAIWDAKISSFRPPTETEVSEVEAHPLAARARVDLVLLSGEKWPAWAPFSQMMMSLLLTQRTRLTGET